MARRVVTGAIRATCVKSVAAVARHGGRQAIELVTRRREMIRRATGATTDMYRDVIRRISALSGAIGFSNQNVRLVGQAAAGVSSFEMLEDRRLLSSVSFTNGILRVNGDANADNRLSTWYSSGGNQIKVWTGKDGTGQTLAASVSSITRVEILGGSKNDRIWVDPKVSKPVWIADGTGNDTVTGGNRNVKLVSSLSGSETPSQPGSDSDPAPTPAPTPSNDTDLIGGDEFSVDNGESSAPRAVLSASSTSEMAGQTIHVNGLGSDLKVGTPLSARYEWDFGDSGSRYNTLVGYNAAHTYDRPGTYRITLYVTNEAGKTGKAETTVTINSDTRRTIYVDRQGNNSNDGSSPGEAVATLARARQLLSDNSEILFQRGDTWDISSGLTLPFNNVVVGAYGSGAKPVLRWTGSGINDIIGLSSGSSRNIVIQDLAFDSAGTAGNGIHVRGKDVTIRNNEFRKVFDAINTNGHPDNLIVQDNTAGSGIQSYFAWIAGTDHVYLGNKVGNAREHVMRLNQYERILISDNDLYNSVKATVNIQRGAYAYVTGNKLTRGGLGTGPLGNGDGFQDDDYLNARSRWIVLENNKVYDVGISVGHGSEHIAIRNNIVDRDDHAAFTIDGYNSAYQRGVNDVTLVNNTAVNNDADGKFLHLLGSANNITMMNNLYVAPNVTMGLNRNAHVYVTGSNLNSFKRISNNVWADANKHWYAEGGLFYIWGSWSNQDGYRTPAEWDAFAQVSDETIADISLNSAFAPSSSSKAEGAATKVAGVFTDINGNVRPLGGVWTAGAVEV